MRPNGQLADRGQVGPGRRVHVREHCQKAVLILGLIVLIRTFLSFSLEIEIEGVWPWRRALASGAGAVMQTTRTALQPGTPPPASTGPPGSP
jgi:hypothetical protein